jgi:hypothetical protein
MTIGFSRADDDHFTAAVKPTHRAGVMVHGEDKQNGPRNSVRAHLYGSFTSFKPEASAGATILPQILKQASFILPCIQDGDDDCEYTIVQPHKFAYILQIKNIAGGWMILAAVNLVASAKAMLRVFGAASGGMQPPRQAAHCRLNYALKSEPADGTLSRMYTARMLSRVINAAYMDHLTPAITRLTDLLDESIVVDDAAIAELRADSGLWMLFNALAGTKLFEEQLKELGQSAVYADEVKRGVAFIEMYQRACLRSGTATSAEIVNFSKTMFDICMGTATVLVDSKELVATDALEPQLTLKAAAWRKDDNDIDTDRILNFLQHSCLGTAPKTWFASAYPHFIKNPLLLVQMLLSKTSAFSAYMPGFLGNSGGEISKYILESMFVIDKTIAVVQHSATNDRNPNTEQKFIQILALFMFKTAAQGGFRPPSGDDVVRRIQELHKTIQATAARLNVSGKKKMSPDVVASIDLKIADIVARVKSADKVFASFLDAKEDGIANYTAHLLETAAADIDDEVNALLAMVDAAPRNSKPAVAGGYSKLATEEGVVIDLAIKSRTATLAAATGVKTVCDGQLATFNTALDKCIKLIDAAAAGGDAAAKQKADNAKTEKADLEKKIRKLTDNTTAVKHQIDELTKLQDEDKGRKDLIAQTIEHNAKVVSSGSGKPMPWPVVV